jgi:membrane protease YdiL (CAAX protease family)
MDSTTNRRRIIMFVTIAYAISIALGLVLFFSGGLYLRYPRLVNPLWGILGPALMFAPTVANIATRLITREGWSNTLLRPNLRRGWRFYLAAWFLPLLATLVGGAIYYLLFPGRFDPSMTYAREELGTIPVGAATDPWTFFITQVALAIAVSASLGLLLGFGEEFGWRAYLLPKMMPLGPRKAVLLVGVIHAVWHWPFIFMGYEYGFGYWGAPVVGPLLFVVLALSLSVFLAWVTLRTGSVWPAALGHGAVNAPAALMLLFISGEPDYLIGPMPVGIIGSLGYVVLAVVIFFSSRALAPTVGPRPVGPEAAEEAAFGAAA